MTILAAEQPAIFHCDDSGPNLTDKLRRFLHVTYHRRSEGDHRRLYYNDKSELFTGLRTRPRS